MTEHKGSRLQKRLFEYVRQVNRASESDIEAVRKNVSIKKNAYSKNKDEEQTYLTDQEVDILLMQYDTSKRDITEFDRIHSTIVIIYITLLGLLIGNLDKISIEPIVLKWILIPTIILTSAAVIIIIMRVRYLYYLYRARIRKIEELLDMYVHLYPRNFFLKHGTSWGLIALVCIATISSCAMLFFYTS